MQYQLTLRNVFLFSLGNYRFVGLQLLPADSTCHSSSRTGCSINLYILAPALSFILARAKNYTVMIRFGQSRAAFYLG